MIKKAGIAVLLLNLENSLSMLLNNVAPRLSLRSIVRFYRIIDFDFRNEPDIAVQVKAYRPRIEHCLQFTPFDCEEVDYGTNKAFSYKTALFGQQTVLSHRKVGRRFLNFQIVFQPGVLSSLFKMPVYELSDMYADAELFFGGKLKIVNEQLALCDSYEKMVSTIEEFLISTFRHQKTDLHPINRIAGILIKNPINKKIEWLANQANLSYRQFDRAFKNNTGVTPKDYRKLIQLDYAYLEKNRQPQLDWLSIALKCGFYDYQHLARSYQNFLGYLPTDFYLLEQKAPERHFGHFEQ